MHPTLTDSHAIAEAVLEHSDKRYCDITLDGGNVVTCAGHRVLTDKVFQENGKPKYDPEFCRCLCKVLDSDIIILPWHCDDSQAPNADIYGHADGLIHWAGDNRVLMSNHRDSFPEEADEMRGLLEADGFEVIEMLFDVPNPGCIVRGFRMRDIARNGGALHCITWNIKKSELPFEPKEQDSILPF